MERPILRWQLLEKGFISQLVQVEDYFIIKAKMDMAKITEA